MSAALVVFDLDGTLIDSRQDLADSANEMLATYGAAPLGIESITAMVGDGAKRLVERALAAAGLDATSPADALVRFLDIYDRRLLNHTAPYSGIVDLVTLAARRAPLAVLTNKPERPSRRLLEALGMAPFFQWVIGGDSGFARKPDPAGLRFLMTAAGVSAANTLLVGDSMVDVNTARAAGSAICAVLYGFGHLREPITAAGGEHVARTPADLAGLVAEFLDSRV